MNAFFRDIHFDQALFELLAHRDETAAVEVEALGLPRESFFHDLLDVGGFALPALRAAHGRDEVKIFTLFFKRPPLLEIQNVAFITVPENEPNRLVAAFFV